MRVQFWHGCVALLGPGIDDLAHTARAQSSCLANEHFHPTPTPFHVTLIAKEELRTLSSPPDLGNLDLDELPVAVGVGGSRKSSVFFVVLLWSAGQTFRQTVGLPKKEFYITLSENLDHSFGKGINALLDPIRPASLPADLRVFEAVCHSLLNDSKQPQRSLEIAVKACSLFPESARAWIRLGDASFALEMHKLAMLSYGRALHHQIDQASREYRHCIRKILRCSSATEWSTLLLEDEIEQIPEALSSHLLAPWSSDVRECVSDAARDLTPTLAIESRVRYAVPAAGGESTTVDQLPRFFQWIVPFELAVMSTPRREEDIDVLQGPQLGFRHIVTLTEEEPLSASWFRHREGIKNTFLPIANYRGPSTEQVDIFQKIVSDPTCRPLLVHCGGGKGRAGSIVACYLVAHGFGRPEAREPDDFSPRMSASQAIAQLRVIRPGSIETTEQERTVAAYEKVLWKRRRVIPEEHEEPLPSAFEVEGPDIGQADFLLLCGIPGSGKSSFAHRLCARDPQWQMVSGDDDGRAGCEAAVGRRGGSNKKMTLDRCNTSLQDRRLFLQLASVWSTCPAVVFFDFPAELCAARANTRSDHPTLPPGSRVRAAIKQHSESLCRPTLAEGFKSVAVVRSLEASVRLVQTIARPIGLLKFPRTPHLLRTTAATEDDIYSSLPAPGTRVILTEKVDGANMGISLSTDRGLVVQNRSHYIVQASHAQFGGLDAWLERHREDLYRILDRDETFPERYTLYGEWMKATHSIAYDRLDDWFLAFDLYDRATQTWADRGGLERLVGPTSVCLVPVVYWGPIPSEQELREMAVGPSTFYRGPREGVYVKVEGDGVVRQRGKVVRAGFISGNENWSKGPLQLNARAVL
jgi:atypical dual specificity phosphatase